MPPASDDLFRFGDFELDVGAYELRRLGQSVRLERQPMDLLILLVERRPQLVTRAEIIERLWGPDTFVEAETGINTAVRKIRHALQDSAASPKYIERVPGKGYRFAAEVALDTVDRSGASRGGATPAPPQPRRSRGIRVQTLLAILALVAAASLATRILRSPPPSDAHKFEFVPLSRLTGSEREPTFSPDGSQVAFAWDSEREDNFDIYVTVVSSSEPKRLTTHPGADLSPQWSPDGRQIAYVRVLPPGDSHQLRVMTALGGSDRTVSDFPAWYRSSWSPDGRYLAVGRAVLPGAPFGTNGIYLVPVDGGEPRALTRPDAAGNHHSPAFSPDGRHLAYASCLDEMDPFDCHIEIQRLDAALQPAGTPSRLTRQTHRQVHGVTWPRDGSFVVYAAGRTSGLWRVRADGSTQPERILEAGEGALYPAASPSSDRLAFSREAVDTDVYRFEPGRPAQPVAQSTMNDAQPAFSADGSQIAFCSDRAGSVEVWTARADGSSPQQLTRGPGLEQCSPAWSPDGLHIAFDSVGQDGFYQIWTMPVDGGAPRQITSGPGDHNVPGWSRDGQWIHFSLTHGGARNIWRAHVQTTAIEQVTKSGSGVWATESADGLGVLYSASTADSPLLYQLYSGGTPHVVVPCLTRGSTVAVGAAGIYYLPCLDERAIDQPIRVLDPATGEDRSIGSLEAYYRPRDFYTANFRKLAVSPDGVILYARRQAAVADLVLIERFR